LEVLYTRHDLEKYLQRQQNLQQRLGFVPTMGALHQGHISLIEKSVAENHQSICSIFVNPEQFNNASDLSAYPRTPEQDLTMLEQAGCSAVWLPDVSVMYNGKSRTGFSFGNLESVLEGAFRPGHFNGVGLILAKFFNILRPDNTYMGLKDLQQFLIVRQLMHDLDIRGNLVPCPTIREPDGLAMSSRNRRLSESERQQAPIIHKTLQAIADNLNASEFQQTIAHAIANFNDHCQAKLEYLEIASLPYLQPIAAGEIPKQVAVCLAAWFGEVRLIDNLILTQTQTGWMPDQVILN
jgi:pantoate--beta-alanine ligase